MQGLGPWSADRRVAVAVSGGADSLCLAWLAAQWGKPVGLIVDHGLRAESAHEAEQARRALAGWGVPSRLVTLRLGRGPGLAERARQARYAALTEAARDAGLADILLGHHAGDQAETVLMRAEAASGPLGLSGMAAIVESSQVRLVRPLLGTWPAQLRATLRAQHVAWSEDPSNADPRALRTRLRARLSDGTLAPTLVADACTAGDSRAAAERDCAAVLADRAAIFPEGYARLSPGPVTVEALAALLRAVAGAAYPARTRALARLAAAPSAGTLGGIRLVSAGRFGPGLLLVRETGAMQPPVPALNGVRWDRRFLLEAAGDLPDEAMLGAVGDDARLLRRHSALPAAVLATLPALRAGGSLAVPHLNCFIGWTNRSVRLIFSPSSPAAGAPFRVLRVGDAQHAPGPHVLCQDVASCPP